MVCLCFLLVGIKAVYLEMYSCKCFCLVIVCEPSIKSGSMLLYALEEGFVLEDQKVLFRL